MQAGVPVTCLEIMDEVQMRVVNLSGSTAPRTWKELPTLFFKFAGSKASVAENISTVQAITSRNGGEEFEFAKDEQEQKLLWSARKESLWSMLALRKEGQDVCEKNHLHHFFVVQSNASNSFHYREHGCGGATELPRRTD